MKALPANNSRTIKNSYVLIIYGDVSTLNILMLLKKITIVRFDLSKETIATNRRRQHNESSNK
jgi:hypothetical protein